MRRRAAGDPVLSPLTTLALIRWAGVVVGVLLTGFGAGYCVTGQWWTGLWLLVVGVVLLSLPLKRRRVLASAQAVGEWPPERVHDTLAAAGAGDASRVERVRALRRAEPRLGLADAVRLVDRTVPGDGPAE